MTTSMDAVRIALEGAASRRISRRRRRSRAGVALAAVAIGSTATATAAGLDPLGFLESDSGRALPQFAVSSHVVKLASRSDDSGPAWSLASYVSADGSLAESLATADDPHPGVGGLSGQVVAMRIADDGAVVTGQSVLSNGELLVVGVLPERGDLTVTGGAQTSDTQVSPDSIALPVSHSTEGLVDPARAASVASLPSSISVRPFAAVVQLPGGSHADVEVSKSSRGVVLRVLQ